MGRKPNIGKTVISQEGLSRLITIERRLHEGRRVTCKALAEELGVTVRTIGRDIAFLRDGAGAPLQFDYRDNTYRLADHTWSLPSVSLTEGELVGLLTAEQMVNQAKGTPLADTLGTLYDKIRQKLTGTVDVEPVILRKQVSFHSRPARAIQQTVWETLFKALRKQRVVKVVYKSLYREQQRSYTIEPVHIACVDGDWYLVAWLPEAESLRSYALSRMVSVTMTEETASPHDFEPEQFFQNRLGRYVGDPGDTTTLVVEFEADVAGAVKERQWHPQQILQERPGGRIRLSFPVPSEANLEIRAWVLQWASAVKVIKPLWLRKDIQREAEEILAVYRKRPAGHD